MDDLRRTLISGSGSGTSIIGTAGYGTVDATEVVQRPWYVILAVRVGRTYGQTLLAFLLAQGVGAIDLTMGVNTALNTQWGTFTTLAYAALLPTTVSLIQNAVEFLTKIDQTNPLFHG